MSFRDSSLPFIALIYCIYLLCLTVCQALPLVMSMPGYLGELILVILLSGIVYVWPVCISSGLPFFLFLSDSLCLPSAQFVHVTPQQGQFRQPPPVNPHERDLSALRDLLMPLVVHQLLHNHPPQGTVHQWKHNHLLQQVVRQCQFNSPLQLAIPPLNLRCPFFRQGLWISWWPEWLTK